MKNLFLVDEAIAKALNPSAKFIESIDASIVLAKGKNSKASVRGAFILPNSTGKVKSTVAVIVDAADLAAAQDFGADILGSSELIDTIAKDRKLEANFCLCTSEMVPKVAKVARILASSDLMPSVKSGTVISIKDMPNVIQSIKRGSFVKYKSDKGGVLNIKIGDRSSSVECIKQNLSSLLNYIVNEKMQADSATAIASIFSSVYLNSTMGKSFPIDFMSLLKGKR